MTNHMMFLLIDLVMFTMTLYLLNHFLSRRTDNVGFSIRNSAKKFGFSIAILSTFLSNGGSETWMHPVMTVVDILLIVGLLFSSIVINDRFILSKFNNSHMIKNGNISVAIVEAGTILATSIILFASMYGEGDYTEGVIFFFFGQISMWIMILFYEKATEFNANALIEANNISVSLVLFSIFVGFSMLIASNIFGESDAGLLADLKSFAIATLFSIGFLLLFMNRFLDKVFFPHVLIDEAVERDDIATVIPYAVIKLSIILIIAFII